MVAHRGKLTSDLITPTPAVAKSIAKCGKTHTYHSSCHWSTCAPVVARLQLPSQATWSHLLSSCARVSQTVARRVTVGLFPCQGASARLITGSQPACRLLESAWPNMTAPAPTSFSNTRPPHLLRGHHMQVHLLISESVRAKGTVANRAGKIRTLVFNGRAARFTSPIHTHTVSIFILSRYRGQDTRIRPGLVSP